MKTTLQKGNIGSKRGWSFSVYYSGLGASIISALFKTKREAKSELNRYIETGKFTTYGSAE